MTDIEAFKQGFRRHAAGVAIITTLKPDGAPTGFTATSLASLSADPPLATFNMAQTASSWPAITEAEHLAIHLLGARNRPVAQILSGDNALRFDGDHWAPGPYGLPIIRDTTALMIGRIVDRHTVAGAAIVVVEIVQGGLGEDDVPLLYHERKYFRPGADA